MDNLEKKLIEDLKSLLNRKYTEQFYLITNNLSINLSSEEVLENFVIFLNKNKIEVVCGNRKSGEDLLIDLINKDQIRIKNKIIFKNSFYNPVDVRAIAYKMGGKVQMTYSCDLFMITTIENAQKLVVLGSFEN